VPLKIGPGIADIVDFIPDDCRGAFYRGEMENQGRQDDDKKSEKFPMKEPLPTAPRFLFTGIYISGMGSVF